MRQQQPGVLIRLGLCLLAGLGCDFAGAQENRWTSSSGGKWENGANWSLGIPPNLNHTVIISNGISRPPLFGSVLVDATSATQPGNMVVSHLRVGNAGGFFAGNDVLNLDNAGLAAPLTVLGSAVISNKGLVTITGSALDVRGGLTLKGGSVVLNADSVLNVKGNNSPGYDLAVDGNLTMNAGTLNFSNSFASGMAIGSVGQGTFTMFGGDWLLGGGAYVNVGDQAGSIGTMTIAGGTASMEHHELAIGVQTNAAGSVWLTGGELITGDVDIGCYGTGEMTVSNGTWRTGLLGNGVTLARLPGSQGTLVLAGGTNIVSLPLVVGLANTNGSMIITGGQLVCTNKPARIEGFAAISNGVWRAREISVAGSFDSFGSAGLTFAGGSTLISSNLTIGYSCAGTGALVHVTGGELIVTNAATNATLTVYGGTLRITGGTVVVDKIVLTSPCARFERTGGTLIYRTAELDPLRDDDGDGPSNALEQSNGFDPLDPADKWRDTDGDGMSDADELVAGTDPRNSNSVVKIISILLQGEDVRLRWKTVGGRNNTIQAASGIGGSNRFIDLATIVIQGTGDRTNTYVDPEGAALGPSRFYRVKVP